MASNEKVLRDYKRDKTIKELHNTALLKINMKDNDPDMPKGPE